MPSTGSAFTSLNGKLCSAALAMLLTSAVIPSAHAQHPEQALPAVRRWTLSALLEVLHAGKDSWGVGPTLGIRRDFRAEVGDGTQGSPPGIQRERRRCRRFGRDLHSSHPDDRARRLPRG